ncbi:MULTISPECIES: FUSC family membrane protein [Ramlibacter]|uniref:FUSC family protein n=1 Tax=Ramlibacter TaxID=174951 RepID=UPI001D1050A2|nr:MULTISPECIES: FUSC family membrane protein [Ramlibacter]
MKHYFRAALRVLLSAQVANGATAAIGLLLASAIVHLILGPVAGAAATTGVIVVTPPDQPGPRKGKLGSMLPAALVGPPLFLATTLLREDWLLLSVLLVGATFIAFLGAAWGKRGLPISVSVMFAMVFALAAPPPADEASALQSALAFTLGAVLYLAWSLLANAVLNPRFRLNAVADSLYAVARLMRTQGRQLAEPTADVLGSLMKQQAALADQLQSARNVLLESPDRPQRQRLAGMLMQVLDMRDHLVACALDLDALRQQPAQQPLLAVLGGEMRALAEALEALADALLTGRPPAPFTLERPPQVLGYADDAALVAPDPQAPPPDVLAAALARRVGYVHDEAARLVALARGEREPDLDVVRVAWQLFVSPTAWSWRPFLSLWRWDAPPLRHALRASLAIATGQAVGLALPWGSHGYWILLTIVVVLRGSLSQTLERRNSRVAGTLLGSALAGFLLYLHLPAAALLLVVGLGQGVAHAFAIRRYLVTAVAATVLALLQAHLLNPGGSPVFDVAERVGDTLIGVLIAWLFSYVLPSWERHQAGALVARALKAQARHAELALQLGTVAAGDTRAELGWRLARREAYDSLSALVQAVQRALSEPRAVRPALQELERMLGHGYQLLAQLTAVKTMLLRRRDHLDIAQLQAPLREAAGAIAQALAQPGSTQAAPAWSAEQQPMFEPPAGTAQDLNPWLLRRLRLATGLAQAFRLEADQAMARRGAPADAGAVPAGRAAGG